ncbi:MAG: DNA-binding response regulator, partial [Alistipes sp.]|nr:DNA-binding response regulator [Alistipes sp.]
MNRFRVAIIEDEVPAARLLRSLVAGLRPQWEIDLLPGSVE